MMGRLLITGASRGIGAATALLAAEEGYELILNYRSERAAAEQIAERALEAGAPRVEVVQGDMALEADIRRVFADIDIRMGPLTHLVNNAGITGRSGRLDETPSDVIRDCIDLNVTGMILVAREAVKRMAARHGGPGGAIVNVSSVAARIGSPGEYVWYAASKAAVDGFTRGLAKEVAMDGIRVNAVAPGMVQTDIHERSTGDVGRIERIRPMVPMQRIGRPEEIAAAIMHLLSDQASYTTGAVLDVSGGR